MSLRAIRSEVKVAVMTLGEDGDAVDMGVGEGSRELVWVERRSELRDRGTHVEVQVDSPARKLCSPIPVLHPLPPIPSS